MARSVVPPGVRGPTPSLFLTGARDIFGEPLLVRAGQRLVGEVAQTMPQEGRALLALAGRRIWVQTQAQLDIGQVIRLQVAVANANRIVLQLTPEGTAAAPPAPRPAPAQLAQVLTRLSIPNTAANRDVVAGMLRQGLPLDPQLVQRLVAATRALPGNPAAALEAGLWLAARRLPISPTAVALVASEVRPNGEPVPVTDRLASARTALAALADEIPLPSPPRGGRPAASRLGAQPGQSDLAGQAPSGSSRGGTPAATANGASTAGTGGSGAPGQLPGSQGGAVAVGAAGAAARPAASVPAAPVAGSVPAATGQEVLDRLIAQPEAASLQAWVRYASTSAENRIAAQLPIVAEDASVPAQMRTGPGEAQMNPDGGGGGGAGMGGQEAEASAEMDTSAETDLGDAEVMAEDAATEDIAEDDSPDSEFDEGDGDLPEEDDSSDDEFDEEDAPEPDLPDDDPESEEEDLDAEEDDEDEPDFDESDDEASEEPDELEELDEPASRRSTSDARSDLGRLLQAL
ncbi:MAG: hypothetical protein CL878_13825, partial [Dehalococcoidia bacterium]|nr:hypothetical protein [Dehalococcoidia bacterium]